MKFIHTADWQIGMRAAHVGNVGARVREERVQAARRVVQLAEQHQADFLLVAGDTFEDNAVDRLLVQKIADVLGAFRRPVYLIPGNHDPLVPGSVWEHPAWPSHPQIQIIGASAAIEIPGGTLYPCPLHEKHSPRDPTAWIDAQADTGIAVGLAHGTVEGIAQNEFDYPIPRHAAVRSGLDYLALGHWHSTATYPGNGDQVCMAYSGTHETTKFGERDSGNILLVEIAARRATPKITSLRTGGLRWAIHEANIQQSGALGEVRETVETMPDPATTLLDVRLEGVLFPTEHAELERIEEIIGSRFLYSRMNADRLLPQPQDDSWLAGVPDGVLRQTAEFLRDLSSPLYSGVRPDQAPPEVAAAALVKLYTLLHEVQRDSAPPSGLKAAAALPTRCKSADFPTA